MGIVYWGPDTSAQRNNAVFAATAGNLVSQVLNSGNGWLQFLDALGKVEGRDQYLTVNGDGFLGLYQFTPNIVRNAPNTVGALLGRFNTFLQNPIVQELTALMWFSGTAPVSSDNWTSRYQSALAAAGWNAIPALWPGGTPVNPGSTTTTTTTAPILFDREKLKTLLGQSVKIQWQNGGANVGVPQTITITPAGLSAGTHLVGQGGVALGLSLIYKQLYNPDGSAKYAPGSVPEVTLNVSEHCGSGTNTAWLADGNGIAFSTYDLLPASRTSLK